MQIKLGMEEFKPDISGALWHEKTRTLIVADLHLEKASFFAVRGQMLPPYDTADTLLNLKHVVERYNPQRLICLGDSFHDMDAGTRLPQSAYDSIDSISKDRELTWITGNHDPEIPAQLPGVCVSRLELGTVLLQHEPAETYVSGHHICGHLHPVARIKTPRGSTRRRCFVEDGRQLVLPAFGSLTGGLNICHSAFSALFEDRRITAYAIGIRQIYAIGSNSCFED